MVAGSVLLRRTVFLAGLNYICPLELGEQNVKFASRRVFYLTKEQYNGTGIAIGIRFDNTTRCCFIA